MVYLLSAIILMTSISHEEIIYLSSKSNLPISPAFETLPVDNEPLKNTPVVEKNDLFENVIISDNLFETDLPHPDSQTIFEYSLDSVSRDNEALSDYSYHNFYSEKLLTNTSRPIIQLPKNRSSIALNIDLVQPNPKFNFTVTKPLNLTKLVNVENFLIGLQKAGNKKYPKIYKMLIRNDSIMNIEDATLENTIWDNDSWKIHERPLVNVLLDSNAISNNILNSTRHVMFIDENKNILIYQISLSENMNKIIMKPILMFYDQTLTNNKVKGFIHKDGAFLIGLKKGGIIQTQIGDNSVKYIHSFHNAPGQSEIEIDINDMKEVGNSVYLSIRQYGIKILNISDISHISFASFDFYYPSIGKLILYNNFPIVGCVANNRLSKYNEFYFELNVTEEFNPKLKRLFVNDKFYEMRSIVQDDRFAFLIESNSNEIILLNKISYVPGIRSVYKISNDAISNRKILKHPFIFRNSTCSAYYGISTLDYFFITPVPSLYSKLRLNFFQEGNYELMLSHHSHQCSNENVKFCTKGLKFSFTVRRLDINRYYTAERLYSFTCCVFFIFIVMIILAYFYQRKCESTEVKTTDTVKDDKTTLEASKDFHQEISDVSTEKKQQMDEVFDMA